MQKHLSFWLISHLSLPLCCWMYHRLKLAATHCWSLPLTTSPLLNPDLGLPFGHVINSRGSQLEEPLLPRLLAVLFEVQHRLQIRHDDGSPAEVLLQRGRRDERSDQEEFPLEKLSEKLRTSSVGGDFVCVHWSLFTCINISLSLSFMSLRAVLLFFHK